MRLLLVFIRLIKCDYLFKVDTSHADLLSEVEGGLLGPQPARRPPVRPADLVHVEDRSQTREPQLLQVSRCVWIHRADAVRTNGLNLFCKGLTSDFGNRRQCIIQFTTTHNAQNTRLVCSLLLSSEGYLLNKTLQ